MRTEPNSTHAPARQRYVRLVLALCVLGFLNGLTGLLHSHEARHALLPDGSLVESDAHLEAPQCGEPAWAGTEGHEHGTEACAVWAGLTERASDLPEPALCSASSLAGSEPTLFTFAARGLSSAPLLRLAPKNSPPALS